MDVRSIARNSCRVVDNSLKTGGRRETATKNDRLCGLVYTLIQIMKRQGGRTRQRTGQETYRRRLVQSSVRHLETVQKNHGPTFISTAVSLFGKSTSVSVSDFIITKIII